MKDVLSIFVIFFLVFVLSLFSAGIWYTFDDRLAEHFNNETIGTIPFWVMYLLTLFIQSVTTTSSNSK